MIPVFVLLHYGGKLKTTFVDTKERLEVQSFKVRVSMKPFNSVILQLVCCFLCSCFPAVYLPP